MKFKMRLMVSLLSLFFLPASAAIRHVDNGTGAAETRLIEMQNRWSEQLEIYWQAGAPGAQTLADMQSLRGQNLPGLSFVSETCPFVGTAQISTDRATVQICVNQLYPAGTALSLSQLYALIFEIAQTSQRRQTLEVPTASISALAFANFWVQRTEVRVLADQGGEGIELLKIETPAEDHVLMRINSEFRGLGGQLKKGIGAATGKPIQSVKSLRVSELYFARPRIQGRHLWISWRANVIFQADSENWQGQIVQVLQFKVLDPSLHNALSDVSAKELQTDQVYLENLSRF